MKTKSKRKTCNVASLTLCEWVSNEEEEQPLWKRKNNQYIDNHDLNLGFNVLVNVCH